MQTGPIAQVTCHHTLTHTSRARRRTNPREASGPWQPWSGGIGARALNPITAGPLPATLLGPLCVSSQPLCSSEHPTKTPGPIGLSPPSSEGRSGLVHPGTDDRQAASATEYYYTSRSYTYEQKQQERALTYMEMRSIMNRNATTSTTTNMRSILDAIRGDVPLFAPGRQLANSALHKRPGESGPQPRAASCSYIRSVQGGRGLRIQSTLRKTAPMESDPTSAWSPDSRHLPQARHEGSHMEQPTEHHKAQRQ